MAKTADDYLRLIQQGSEKELAAAEKGASLDPKVEPPPEPNRYDEFVREHPATSSWLSRDDNITKVEPEARETLGLVERIWGDMKHSFETGTLITEMAEIGEAHFLSAYGQGTVTAEQEARYKEIKAHMAERGENPYELGFVGGIPGASAEQVPIQGQIILDRLLFTAGTAATAAAVGGALTMGRGALPMGKQAGRTAWNLSGAVASARLETSLAMLEYIDEGIAPEDARALAGMTGVINGALEMFGIERLVDKMPGLEKYTRAGVRKALRSMGGRDVVLRAARRIAGTGAVEGTTEYLQEMVTTAVGLLGKEDFDTADEFIDALFTVENKERFEAGAIAGVQGGIGLGSVFTAPNVAADVQEVGRAKRAKQAALDLGEQLQQANMDPNVAADAVNAVSEEADLYFDVETWDEYFQETGIDPRAVAEELTGDADAYDTAREEGGQIRVSVGQYAAKLAPGPHGEHFSNELRTAPEAMNAREAVELERVAREQFDTDSNAIYETMVARLEAAGHDRDTASDYAANVKAGITTLAQRSGQDAIEMFNRYGLQITNAALAPEGSLQQSSDGKYTTGQPVTIQFARNPEPSPDMGRQFQQDIEPAGRYVVESDTPPEGWESGSVTFNNPLVLPLNEGDGVYDERSWKVALQRRFNATGEALSQAIVDAGHDGIVTYDEFGSSEIVDLTGMSPTPGAERDAVTGSTEAGGLPESAGVRGSEGVLAGPRGPDQSLEGLPTEVLVDGEERTFGVFRTAAEVAQRYAESAGLDYNPPRTYAKVDRPRARRIAAAFDEMEHDPGNPEVAAAYAAMIDETLAQYRAILETGLTVEFIDGPDPYGNPRNVMQDVIENNHMWVYSTRDGFGSDDTFDVSQNPLLAETEFEISGQVALANDIFRVVHDYFGHIKEGVGFRAEGEENAWRAHSAMYSPLARRAMTSETRGQNSWVNYGPHGAANRKASAADTVYADQKIGLLPEWVVVEGANDPPAGGLAMDLDSRMRRAREQGFDTSRVYYVSSLEDLSEFGPHGRFAGHSGVSGISVTDNPEMASRYLDRFGAYRYDGEPFAKNVMPVYIRHGRVLEADESPFKSPVPMGHPLPEGYQNPMVEAGYDTMILPDSISRGGPVKHSDAKNAIRGKEVVVADPANIRSVNAAFDPNESTSPNLLFQTAATAAAEDSRWSRWLPQKTSTGKIRGAPEWVNDNADMQRMYRELNRLIKEGEAGRYWYEESARRVMEVVRGDLRDAEKLIQLIAIYSPQANVDTNTVFAVRAWTQWKNGVSRDDFKVKTASQDAKAVGVLYDDSPFEGRKTSSFYLNLMHDIIARNPNAIDELQLDTDLVEALEKPVTIDMWMYRAFGYERDQAGDDIGTGRYSFSENATRRLTAKMNQKLPEGEERWTPHQVQAAIWSAMKARYEMPEVKEATWSESIDKGYAFINEDGDRTAPTDAASKREHGAIWRRHAMAVASNRVPTEVERSRASFDDFLARMTEVVTWEAMPSPSLGLDILNESQEVKALFTLEARALLMDDGADLLAERLGVPLNWVVTGAGAYEGDVSPNNLSHLLPNKGQGGFSRDQVRQYARAIQYIYKQDAVPWFRADPRAMLTKSARDKQAFRVVKTATGKAISGGKVETLAEAKALAETRGEGFEVRGGPFARGVVMTFATPLGQPQLDALASRSGFTQTGPDEVTFLNYRDDSTGVPDIDDEVFLDSMQALAETFPGVTAINDFWSEGEYGNVHDWESDPQGEALVDDASFAGSPDLQAWLRDRRSAFESLLERYTGEQLELRREDAQTYQELNQPAFHGSPHTFDRFGLHAIGTGEGAQAYGWGLYFTSRREIAEYYRDELSSRAPQLVNGVTPQQLLEQLRSEADDLRSQGLSDKALDAHAGKIMFAEDLVGAADPEDLVQQLAITVELRGNALEEATDPDVIETLTRLVEQDEATLEWTESLEFSEAKGRLFEVDIPEAGELLDYDATFEDMPDGVQAALRASEIEENIDLNGRTGREIYLGIGQVFGGDQEASEFLLSAGIPGLSFIGDSSGARNYVIWDENAIAIERMEQTKRGYTRIFGDRRMEVGLLKDADLSTVLHETGHLMLEIFRDVAGDAFAATDPTVDQAILMEDARGLLNWLGVDSFEAIGVDQHEQFARGFEAYLREGKPPSEALRGPFARFKAWLTLIYQRAQQLDVSLNDEVRGIFDRMLATDAEIEAARGETELVPLFTTAADAGMSEGEFEAYSKQARAANLKATDSMQRRLMQEWRRERQKWWKEETDAVRDEVRAELVAEVPYRAIVWAAEQQLATADVRTYGPDVVKALRRHKVLAKDGMPIAAAAEVNGYGSADEFILAMAGARPIEAEVASRADAIMRDRHGSVYAGASEMADAARTAVLNDEQAKIIHAELAALHKQRRAAQPAIAAREREERAGVAQIRAVPPAKVFANMARERVAALKVRDLRPGQHMVAMRKASREAAIALAKKDYDTAVDAKQREMLSFEMYRQTLAARDEAEKQVRFIRTFETKRVRQRLGHTDYLDQVDSILDRFDFKRRTLKAVDEIASLGDFIDAQAKRGIDVVLPESVLNEANRKNYRDMSVEELGAVRDSIQHLDHLSRAKDKAIKGANQARFQDVVEDLVHTIESTSNGALSRARQAEQNLPKASFALKFRSFLAQHRKVASYVRVFDGFKEGGIWWETFARRFNEAGAEEAGMRAEASEKLKKLFAPYTGAADMVKTKAERASFGAYTAPNTREKYHKGLASPVHDGNLSHMGVLMVALNWGNAGNRQRLLSGYQWDAVEVQRVLNQEMAKQDWEFVQGVWRMIDSYWPKIRALSKRVDGIAVEKVDGVPVETPFGVIAGGYFPIKRDPATSTRGYREEAREAVDRAKAGATMRASTRDGHRKERADQVTGEKLLLDPSVIFNHVNYMIHDLTHYEALIDAERVIRSPDVQSAIREHYGIEVYQQFQTYLEDIASEDLQINSQFEKTLLWLRSGVSIVGMGLNFSTAAIQITGYSQSIVRLGASWAWSGMTGFYRNPVKIGKEILAKSPTMANRSRTQLREINEIQNQLQGNTNLTQLYFMMIVRMQQTVDMPTWYGGYLKALDAGESEARAIQIADQIVLDSQMGGQVKDLSAIQRGGPALKLFTSFYSYFNATMNLTAESLGRTKFTKPKDVAALLSDILFLYTIPATLGLLITDAIKPGDEDEDLAERILMENISFAMGTLVGMREIGGAMRGFANYSGPAGTRFWAELSRLATQTSQGEPDVPFFKAANQVAGMMLHYPAGQVQRTVLGMVAVAEGKTDGAKETIQTLMAGPERK